MIIVGVATVAASAFAIVQAPEQKKSDPPKKTDVVAFQGAKQNTALLLGDLTVRQNCGACHSPSPDSKAAVCPKGSGALSVVEYYSADAMNPTTIQYHPTLTMLTLAPKPESKLGLTLRPVGDGLRTHLKLAADEGVLVEEVAKDSVLADADVKKHDVLVAIDDEQARVPDKVVELLLNRVTADKDLKLSLVRQGKPQNITIRLAPTLRARLVEGHPLGETRFRIGVSLAGVDETLRQHLKIPTGEGAVVTSVEADGAATDAKIRPHDILLRWNEEPIASSEGLIDVIQKNGPKTATVKLFREGKLSMTKVTPKPIPAAAEVLHFQAEVVNRVQGQPLDPTSYVRMGRLFGAAGHFSNVDPATVSVESEIAAALAQTKALQGVLERLQAKVAEKKEAVKPPAKK